jgi:hypothetical protein
MAATMKSHRSSGGAMKARYSHDAMLVAVHGTAIWKDGQQTDLSYGDGPTDEEALNILYPPLTSFGSFILGCENAGNCSVRKRPCVSSEYAGGDWTSEFGEGDQRHDILFDIMDFDNDSFTRRNGSYK